MKKSLLKFVGLFLENLSFFYFASILLNLLGIGLNFDKKIFQDWFWLSLLIFLIFYIVFNFRMIYFAFIFYGTKISKKIINKPHCSKYAGFRNKMPCLITRLFSISLLVFIAMTLVQGFKWYGFFEKHLGIDPTWILVFSILTGYGIVFLFKEHDPSAHSTFKLVSLISRKLFAPFFLISLLTVLIYCPATYNFFLKNFYFHLHWMGNAFGFSALVFGLFTYIEQRFLKKQKFKFDILFEDSILNKIIKSNLSGKIIRLMTGRLMIPILLAVITAIMFVSMNERSFIHLILSLFLTLIIICMSLVLAEGNN